MLARKRDEDKEPKSEWDEPVLPSIRTIKHDNGQIEYYASRFAHIIILQHSDVLVHYCKSMRILVRNIELNIFNGMVAFSLPIDRLKRHVWFAQIQVIDHIKYCLYCFASLFFVWNFLSLPPLLIMDINRKCGCDSRTRISLSRNFFKRNAKNKYTNHRQYHRLSLFKYLI